MYWERIRRLAKEKSELIAKAYEEIGKNPRGVRELARILGISKERASDILWRLKFKNQARVFPFPLDPYFTIRHRGGDARIRLR